MTIRPLSPNWDIWAMSKIIGWLKADSLHPCIPTGTPSPPNLLHLSAFHILIFMVKECLGCNKTKTTWDQLSRHILFWWPAAFHGQFWMRYLPGTSLTAFLLPNLFTVGVSYLIIIRFVNGGPLKHWRRFLIWKWETLENLIRNSCSSARMWYSTVSKPVRMQFLMKLFCSILTLEDRIMFIYLYYLPEN